MDEITELKSLNSTMKKIACLVNVYCRLHCTTYTQFRCQSLASARVRESQECYIARGQHRGFSLSYSEKQRRRTEENLILRVCGVVAVSGVPKRNVPKKPQP